MEGSPRRLDLDAWERAEHFRFFRDYENPYFNVCAEVDVRTVARRCAEPDGGSFFLSTLFLALGAVNDVEEFRYRIRGDDVVVHDVVHGGSTVLASDRTFAFAYFDWDPSFDRFVRGAGAVLEAARVRPVALEDRPERDDLVHFSVVPWIAFTSIAHARRGGEPGSVPRIVLGRRHGHPGRERMPVSVEVHHALVDGLHVGRFFERYQARLDEFDPRSARGAGPPGER